MPHQRERYLRYNIDQLKSFSPLIGLLGHRQVGKTTLLEQIAAEYITLDDQKTFSELQNDPQTYFNKNHKKITAIDEVQLLPSLFPALKERVRTNKAPGQFILSGSVRFTSRKAIQESLTGRIMNLELLPMTLSEIKHLSRPTILLQILNSNVRYLEQKIEEELKERKQVIDQVDLYFERGGLPGVCFIRNEKNRLAKISEQLLTILDRDLRSVVPTTLPYSQILFFVRELAKAEGEQINHSALRRITGISEVTQKKLLYALESVFIIRTLPIQGDRKGIIIFFEDQLEHRFLSEEMFTEQRAFEGLCYRNARAQFFYDYMSHYSFSHFLSKGHSRIPFAVNSKNNSLGFIPILEDKPTRSQMAMASSYLRKFSNSKVVFLSKGKHFNIIDDRHLVIPVHII